METNLNAPFKAYVEGLQWSHAQPNVETEGFRCLIDETSSASMEPRSAERGNQIKIARLITREAASMEPRSAERGNAGGGLTFDVPSWASMEPRSAERGNPGLGRKIKEQIGASMEPRSAERGNKTSEVSIASETSGFNGATLSRTWKRRRQ